VREPPSCHAGCFHERLAERSNVGHADSVTKRANRRTGAERPEHIFFLLGTLGALFGALVAVLAGGDDVWQVLGAAIIGLASALVAVAAATYVWNWLGGDPLRQAMEEVDESTRRLDGSVGTLADGVAEAVSVTTSLREAVRIVEDTYRTGLRRFHPHASEFGVPSRWIELIERAQQDVDLMGWTLRGWWNSEKIDAALEKALSNGVNIRVLVMDPDSPMLNNPSGKHKTPEVVQNELRYSISRFETVEQRASEGQLPGTITIRHATSDALKWHVCRTDDRAVCVPYFQSVLPSESPLLDIERTSDGLLSLMEREFEFLWGRAII
jgi:hypothetical protein